jgi:hypothetical protein
MMPRLPKVAMPHSAQAMIRRECPADRRKPNFYMRNEGLGDDEPGRHTDLQAHALARSGCNRCHCSETHRPAILESSM